MRSDVLQLRRNRSPPDSLLCSDRCAFTRILCDVPVESTSLWPVWSLDVAGKAPVKGFTQAREPKDHSLARI